MCSVNDNYLFAEVDMECNKAKRMTSLVKYEQIFSEKIWETIGGS